MKIDHAKIIEMLEAEKTMQEIVDVVNPGKSWQSMQQYVKRHFECTMKWRERKVVNKLDEKELQAIKDKKAGMQNKMEKPTGKDKK